jgi:hypothetical protein
MIKDLLISAVLCLAAWIILCKLRAIHSFIQTIDTIESVIMAR